MSQLTRRQREKLEDELLNKMRDAEFSPQRPDRPSPPLTEAEVRRIAGDIVRDEIRRLMQDHYKLFGVEPR